MKRIYVLIVVCTLAASINAETKDNISNHRSEIRIGWGDQLFESLVWHNPAYIVRTMPDTYYQVYNENYSYDQHLWIEYQWRFTSWFAFGGMVDVSDVRWDEVTRNGQGIVTQTSKGHFFYNIVFAPTMRFTYFFHPNVNLYSALGGGIGVNGGSEMNIKGQKTDIGAAVNITLLGMSVNAGRWFCSVDIGGLYSLKDMNTIFLASSRMINVGMGIRF
ncbi:MAG: hypothetical protein K5660_08005 [Paludibacteraceae bacterium]|nr:hypothetical protein [Paludibacteraceae bacterium]